MTACKICSIKAIEFVVTEKLCTAVYIVHSIVAHSVNIRAVNIFASVFSDVVAAESIKSAVGKIEIVIVSYGVINDIGSFT